MKLRVTRTVLGQDFTFGLLLVDGKQFCNTLEPTDRNLEQGGAKVKGSTAIPCGTYKVAWTYSNKYRKKMPELLDVPQFEGVRIHGGNTSKDSEGCILVGDGDGFDKLKNSTAKKDALWAMIEQAITAGEDVEIEIKKL